MDVIDDLEVTEDPGRPGYFYATYAPEFQTHAAGQIVALDGDPATIFVGETIVTRPRTRSS